MSYDTWLHKVSRHIARPLVNTRVTPNHLTTGRLLSALGAAALFMADARAADLAGAVLFIVSMLLDRADGELARLQGSSSRFGAYYDLVTDALGNSAIFIGLGFAAADGFLGGLAVPAGIVAAIAISIILTLVIFIEAELGHGASSFESRAGFDPDDAMILIPLGVLFGLGDWLVASAAIGAPVAAVIVSRELWRRRKPKSGS